MIEPVTCPQIAAMEYRKMVYLDFLVGKWNSQYIELFKYDENVFFKKMFWSNQERQMSSAVLTD